MWARGMPREEKREERCEYWYLSNLQQKILCLSQDGSYYPFWARMFKYAQRNIRKYKSLEEVKYKRQIECIRQSLLVMQICKFFQMLLVHYIVLNIQNNITFTQKKKNLNKHLGRIERENIDMKQQDINQRNKK